MQETPATGTARNPNRKKLFALGAALFAVAAALGGAVYVRARYFTPERMSALVTAQIQKRTARKFSFRHVRHTGGGTLVFDDVVLKENAAFAGGDFLRAERLTVKPDLRSLIAGKADLDGVEVFNGTLLIKRNAAGEWNFGDILALCDPNKPGRPVADVRLDGGLLRYEDAMTGTNLVFSGLKGFYRYDGSDRLKLDSRVSGLFRGGRMTASSELDSMARFTGRSLTEVRFAMNLSDVSSDDMDAERLELAFVVKDLHKPLYARTVETAFSASEVTLKGLGSASYGRWTYWLAVPFKTLSTLQGASIPNLNALRVDKLETKFHQRDGRWETLELRVAGPDLKIGFEGCADPALKKADFELNMKAGSAGLDLAVWGPLDNPEFKPEVSYAVGGALRDALAKLRGLFDGKYPVATTGK